MTESVLLESEGFRPRPDFKIFTKGMEIIKDADSDDGLRRIRCIASSSVKDLHGDVMTAACVRSMARQAEGLTIFRNHMYRVPEDVFGRVEKARTKKVSASEAKRNGWIEQSSTSQEDVVLLQLDVVVSAGSEIDATMAHLENGVTLGVSIGANITDYEEAESDEKSWWPPLIINDVDLLEASIVGIPANPLSWVEGATKGLITKGAIPGVNEATFKRAQKQARAEAETDGWEDPKVTKKAADDKPTGTPEEELEKIEDRVDDDPSDDDEAKEPEKLEAGADGPEVIVAHYQMQVEQGLASRTDLDAMEELVQHSMDYALANGVDKDAFDGRTAADLAKEILETLPAAEAGEDPATDKAGAPEGDQEAPDEESDPESDDAGAEGEEEDKEEVARAAAEVELKALTESGIFKTFEQTVQAFEEALTQNHILRAQNEALDLEKQVLTVRLATAENDVREAVALVKKITSLPIGRKAVFQREAAEGVSKLKGGPYGDDVIAILYPEGATE